MLAVIVETHLCFVMFIVRNDEGGDKCVSGDSNQVQQLIYIIASHNDLKSDLNATMSAVIEKPRDNSYYFLMSLYIKKHPKLSNFYVTDVR